MHTKLRIEGANCSFCFNEALDELRRTNGVLDVRGSLAGPCIDITHESSVDTDTFTSIIRSHVHGIEMYANEIRMIPLEPSSSPPICDHA